MQGMLNFTGMLSKVRRGPSRRMAAWILEVAVALQLTAREGPRGDADQPPFAR